MNKQTVTKALIMALPISTSQLTDQTQMYMSCIQKKLSEENNSFGSQRSFSDVCCIEPT